MQLTTRKRRLDQIDINDKLKKYEEQKGEINELGHEIMKLKQQIDEFKDLKDEWNDLNR